MKRYYPINNGARPFVVEVMSNSVAVYKNSSCHEKDLLLESPYIKIFIGKNNPPFKPFYSGQFTGSSILALVKVKKIGHFHVHTYLYIGASIYFFDINEQLTHFYSVMGNSGVVYPYASVKVDYNEVEL